MHMRQIIDARQLDLQEKVVEVRRVTKVVKGGRNFRFAALVVVGDENGHVGIGSGKAMEVPDAIRKAVEDAKKNLIKVPMVGTTIPHEVIGHFGAGRIIIMPAQEGTGVIAGGAARDLLELAGLKDVRAKCLGTRNPRNMVNATIEGLKSLKTAEQVAALRGKKVEEALAIFWHMGPYDKSEYMTPNEMGDAFSKNGLAYKLHTADMMATYVLENENIEWEDLNNK